MGGPEPRSPDAFHPPRCLPFAREGRGLSPDAAGTRAVGGGREAAGGAGSSDKVVRGILQQDASGESPSGEPRKAVGGSSQAWGQGRKG